VFSNFSLLQEILDYPPNLLTLISGLQRGAKSSFSLDQTSVDGCAQATSKEHESLSGIETTLSWIKPSLEPIREVDLRKETTDEHR
jgi:hypothetical protein